MADQNEAALASPPTSSLGLTKTEGSRRGSDRVEPPYGVGAFQLLALFSLTIAGGAFLLHNESFRLTAVAMDHWCRRPPNFTNVSVAKWKHIAIPLDGNGQHSHCTVRDPPDGGSMARVVPCTSWEYDHGTYGHNIVSEWNLVCERRWLIDLAKMIYSASAMVSLPLLGALADRVGRKPVIFIAVPVVLAAGGAVNLPINFPTFVAVRAIVSISTSALMPPLLSLVYEVSPVEKIPAYNVGAWMFSVLLVSSTFTAVTLAGGGWSTVQFGLMVPTSLLMLLYYTVDEPMAWLLAHGDVKKAQRAALRAAKLNRACTDSCHESFVCLLLATSGDCAQQQTGVLVLCSKQFRTRTVLLACGWTVLAYSVTTVVSNDVPLSDIASVMSMVLSVVAGVVAAFCVPYVGFRFVLVVSAIAFSLSSALMANIFTVDVAHLRDSLTLVTHAAGNVAVMMFFAPAMFCYPVAVHCMAIGGGLAWSRLGVILGQLSPLVVVGRRVELQLTVAAVAMALFAVVVKLLPNEADWKRRRPPAGVNPEADGTSQDVRQVGQQSSMAMPQSPVRKSRSKTRSPGKPSSRRNSLRRSRSPIPTGL
ncbi:beta-alanine transporter-like [Amblyomma americanum]